MPFSRYDSMDVQDQLVKCTFNDLDVAPAGKLEPDEFDVNPCKVSEGLGLCSCIYYYPPSHTHTRIAIQTDIICLNAQYRCCASIKSSTCPILSIPTIFCVSIHQSDQTNAKMWHKWDKFHRNISPGGGWNSTAWCRDYINVRAYMWMHNCVTYMRMWENERVILSRHLIAGTIQARRARFHQPIASERSPLSGSTGLAGQGCSW